MAGAIGSRLLPPFVAKVAGSVRIGADSDPFSVLIADHHIFESLLTEWRRAPTTRLCTEHSSFFGAASPPTLWPRRTCIGHARDRYQRLLAVCYAGGESINARIVREGWALDFRRYSSDYLQAEADAKRASAGLWRGEFTPPWEWRAERR